MDKKTAYKPYRFLNTLITLTVVVYEGMYAYMIYKEAINIQYFIYIHAAVVLGLLGWLGILRILKGSLRFPSILCLLTAVMGIYGSIMSIAIIFLYAIYRREAISFTQWFNTLFPEDPMNDADRLYERLVHGWDDFTDKHHVTPYLDIMSRGTEDQKRLVLERITYHFRPSFSPILIKALGDPSNAIRVQAATTITKIETNFVTTTQILKEKLAKNPHDTKSLLILAKKLDGYAHSGLTDQERAKDLCNQAIEIYQRFLTLEPNDAQTKFYLGRLYMRGNHYLEAYNLLKDSLEADGFRSVKKVMWYLECLFQLKRFREIHELSHKAMHSLVDKDGNLPVKVQQVLRIWIDPSLLDQNRGAYVPE